MGDTRVHNIKRELNWMNAHLFLNIRARREPAFLSLEQKSPWGGRVQAAWRRRPWQLRPPRIRACPGSWEDLCPGALCLPKLWLQIPPPTRPQPLTPPWAKSATVPVPVELGLWGWRVHLGVCAFTYYQTPDHKPPAQCAAHTHSIRVTVKGAGFAPSVCSAPLSGQPRPRYSL